MNCDFNKTWETYTSSWKVESADDKRAIFEECLYSECKYTDPLVKTSGWDELLAYMIDFHQMVPGGHFETYYFLAHNNQSIAKWYMKSGDNNVIGEGISHGRYNEAGKLISMTGFFEPPQQ